MDYSLFDMQDMAYFMHYIMPVDAFDMESPAAAAAIIECRRKIAIQARFFSNGQFRREILHVALGFV